MSNAVPSHAELPHVLPANMTNVWVLEVGCKEYPGDLLIKDIAQRQLRQLCFPRVFLNEMPVGFPPTLFLKPKQASVQSVAAVGYVTVAITMHNALQDQRAVACDCPGSHDSVKNVCIDFSEVRRMSPVRVSYTNGRGPYQLPVGDEVTRVVAALATAAYVEDEVAHRDRIDARRTVVTNEFGLLVYSKPARGMDQAKGTRALERARAKQARMAKQQAGGAFYSARTNRVGVPMDVCCEQRNCARLFSVSNSRQEGLDRLLWYRNFFQALDEEKRRHFIAKRIRHEYALEDGPALKRWTLETPETITSMVRTGRDVLIEVGNKPTTVVCGDFFCYALGITKNKLYQPTVQSPDFQTSVPRASTPRGIDIVGKALYVAMWLLQLAEFYLHDPAADQIILPFADKRAVYDMYLDESQDPVLKAKWAPLGVPSRAWFYKAWNDDEDCRKIKVRKTLRFSLCPDCVKYIEVRQHVLNDAERQAVKALERTHHMFVRRERMSYYLRRQQAVLSPSTYFSIIIDGADRSAFGSPHHYIHSKGRTHTANTPSPYHPLCCPPTAYRR